MGSIGIGIRDAERTISRQSFAEPPPASIQSRDMRASASSDDGLAGQEAAARQGATAAVALRSAQQQRERAIALLEFLAEVDEIDAEAPTDVIVETAHLFLDLADVAETGARILLTVASARGIA